MGWLIPVSVLAFALNGALTRAVQIKYPGKKGFLRIYQGFFCLVAAVIFTVSALIKGGLSLSWNEVGYGIFFGAFFYGAVVGSALGYEWGSMSLTSIITNLSLLFPLIYSCTLAKESLAWLQVVGIVLMLTTLILSVNRDKRGGKTTWKWVFAVLLAFGANGITAVTQKHYVRLHTDGNLAVFMAVAYLTAALLFFATSAVVCRKTGEKPGPALGWLLGFSLLSGLGSYGGNLLLGMLSVRVPGAVLYPCINGGLCIVTALISFLVFREKPTLRKLLAIAIGIAAITLLSL